MTHSLKMRTPRGLTSEPAASPGLRRVLAAVRQGAAGSGGLMKSDRKPSGRSPDAVSLQRRKDIWRLHRLGWGNRHIARRLTIHHSLVAYYLKTGPASPAARPSNGDPVKAKIAIRSPAEEKGATIISLDARRRRGA